MFAVIMLLLPEALLIGCGYVLCRYTALNRKLWDQLDRLVYFFLFPLLLFRSIGKADFLFSEQWLFIIGAITFVSINILLVYVIGRVQIFHKRAFASSAQVAFRFNSFIALAIAASFDDAVLLVYLSLLIGLSVPLLNIAALWFMMGQTKKATGSGSFIREIAKNPLVIGAVSGLCAAIIDLPVHEILAGILDRLGQIALTLGLLCVGAGVHFRTLGTNKRLGLTLLGIKHAVNPLVASMLCIVCNLNTTQTLALLIFSALPTATSCYVLAKNMQFEAGYVAGLVSISTMLGMPSIGFAIYLSQYY